MIKPGYKTTEFWLLILGNILIGLNAVASNGTLSGNAQAILTFSIVILNGAYILGRSFVKAAAPTVSG